MVADRRLKMDAIYTGGSDVGLLAIHFMEILGEFKMFPIFADR